MNDGSSDGKGQIVVSRYGDEDQQVLSTLSYQYPLKLISPRGLGQPCLSVFIMSYGGGLVGGDQIDLSVTIQKESKLSLLTQGSTKIFKQRGAGTTMQKGLRTVTSQTMRVIIEARGLLALLPDPIQPFADSSYQQYQSFEMHSSGNLILLDWVTSGRPARGENWTLSSFRSRNDIFEIPSPEESSPAADKKLVLRDTLILNSNVARSMSPHECFATLILRGPLLQEFSESVVMKFRNEERVRRPSVFRGNEGRKERATWTAGIVRGCCVVKVMGEKSEIVKELLRELIVVEEMEKMLGREALRALL
jgi:urease accessory protein